MPSSDAREDGPFAGRASLWVLDGCVAPFRASEPLALVAAAAIEQFRRIMWDRRRAALLNQMFAVCMSDLERLSGAACERLGLPAESAVEGVPAAPPKLGLAYRVSVEDVERGL